MSKAPMLDMFKRVLPSLDTRNKKFYESLTDEEKKGFSPWLVQRYLSSAESSNPQVIEHYLIMTNELVNVNFSDVKDPEMIWKLMSIVGIGKSVKHPYVAPGKGRSKKKVNAFKQWLHDSHPYLNDTEIDIWYSSFDKKSALDFLEQHQIKDKDILASANDL